MNLSRTTTKQRQEIFELCQNVLRAAIARFGLNDRELVCLVESGQVEAADDRLEELKAQVTNEDASAEQVWIAKVAKVTQERMHACVFGVVGDFKAWREELLRQKRVV